MNEEEELLELTEEQDGDVDLSGRKKISQLFIF